MGIFFVTTSEYKTGKSTILFQAELYNYEYVLQGFTVLKLLLLLYCVLLWIYANHITKYDVYLYSRYPHVKVFVSKFYVIVELSLVLSGFLGSLFVLVWSLYPQALAYDVIFVFFVMICLFVVFYNMLFLLFSMVVKHLYGVFIPLLGYLISMITVDMNNNTVGGGLQVNYSHILFPDIVYYENRFMFMYGGLFVFCEVVLMGYIVIHIFRKNDIM